MELREKILNTSKTMFCEYGLKRVSIDDICNELRISKKTFYSVFKQKEELIECLLLEMHEQKKQEQVIDIKDNIIESLLQNSYVFKQRSKKEQFLIMHDLSKYYPQILQKYKEVIKQNSLEEVSTFLEKGIEQDLFRKEINMELMSHFISESMTNFFSSIQDNKKAKWAVLIDFFIDTIIHLTANENGLKYYFERKNN
jgi:AcrR family transcriptional regulator